ncbi:hypothetical protein [Calothrix sp. NIES-2098]|uniref:hypothetical protein n=1 Tax=Calothrix sp. NIES-2098 TaxID=1954171 RepID=UPI0030D905F6
MQSISIPEPKVLGRAPPATFLQAIATKQLSDRTLKPRPPKNLNHQTYCRTNNND